MMERAGSKIEELAHGVVASYGQSDLVGDAEECVVVLLLIVGLRFRRSVGVGGGYGGDGAAFKKFEPKHHGG